MFSPWRFWLSSNQKKVQVLPESAANSHGSTLQLLCRSSAACLLIIQQAAEEDSGSLVSQNSVCLNFSERCVGKCRPAVCFGLRGSQIIWLCVICVCGVSSFASLSSPSDQVCLCRCFLRTRSAGRQLLPVNTSAPAHSLSSDTRVCRVTWPLTPPDNDLLIIQTHQVLGVSCRFFWAKMFRCLLFYFEKLVAAAQHRLRVSFSTLNLTDLTAASVETPSGAAIVAVKRTVASLFVILPKLCSCARLLAGHWRLIFTAWQDGLVRSCANPADVPKKK